MIHDKNRVTAIRAGLEAQIKLIKSLQAKIVNGEDETLKIARFQTEDVETFFLQDLDRNDRTPAEEAQWLSKAEQMLGVWTASLKQTAERFSKYGDRIQIVGG